MNRTKPAFRCFDMSDQEDGRPFVWHEVEVDNSPGRELTLAESNNILHWLEKQPWSHLFWTAFKNNKKATVYQD